MIRLAGRRLLHHRVPFTNSAIRSCERTVKNVSHRTNRRSTRPGAKATGPPPPIMGSDRPRHSASTISSVLRIRPIRGKMNLQV